MMDAMPTTRAAALTVIAAVIVVVARLAASPFVPPPDHILTMVMDYVTGFFIAAAAAATGIAVASQMRPRVEAPLHAHITTAAAGCFVGVAFTVVLGRVLDASPLPASIHMRLAITLAAGTVVLSAACLLLFGYAAVSRWRCPGRCQ
jgi:hypothetical protein